MHCYTLDLLAWLARRDEFWSFLIWMYACHPSSLLLQFSGIATSFRNSIYRIYQHDLYGTDHFHCACFRCLLHFFWYRIYRSSSFQLMRGHTHLHDNQSCGDWAYGDRMWSLQCSVRFQYACIQNSALGDSFVTSWCSVCETEEDDVTFRGAVLLAKEFVIHVVLIVGAITSVWLGGQEVWSSARADLRGDSAFRL